MWYIRHVRMAGYEEKWRGCIEEIGLNEVEARP